MKKKLAERFVFVFVVIGFLSMCLLLSSMGLSYSNSGPDTSATDVASLLEISRFKLGIASSIIMVVSFYIASFINRQT